MDKRWIPSEAVRVTAVGNERVAIAGPTPAACSIYADKLGTYRRVKGQEANGHAFCALPAAHPRWAEEWPRSGRGGGERPGGGEKALVYENWRTQQRQCCRRRRR